jgi:hypothetical protein
VLAVVLEEDPEHPEDSKDDLAEGAIRKERVRIHSLRSSNLLVWQEG